MKFFDDYKNTLPYPNRQAYKNQLVDYINGLRLTSQERASLLAGVPVKVAEWFNEAIKPYNEEEGRLMEMFWADCREDIGYDEFLDETGVQVLQGYAWERGHSGGHQEVWNCLIDLAEFAEKLVGHGKGK